MKSTPLFRLTACALLASALTLPAAAQEIARLYAPRAPAGSAYVRVISAAPTTIVVDFGGRRETLDGRHPASDYRIINAASPMALTVAGQPQGPQRLAAGGFYSVIVGAGTAQLVADSTDGRDDLKAELRFYNLLPGCGATLSLLNGPAVFADTPFQGHAKRNINPVKADLVAACSHGAASGPVAMPALKAGDHVSFFLRGVPGKPQLTGQVDATEAATSSR